MRPERHRGMEIILENGNKKVTKVPRFGTRYLVISPYPPDIPASRSYL